MMKTYEEMTQLFERANRNFINNDIDLFKSRVSERTLCGALMLHMHDLIVNNSNFQNYYTDIEYNRNKGGKLKTIKKTICNDDSKIINITCDLILHSRGEVIAQDNLIAVEMKKFTRSEKDKNSDRERLMALTKDSFDDIWSFDGKTLPEHVCRYVLGVYYEIDYSTKDILIEYYKKGKLAQRYRLSFTDYK